MTLSVGVVGPAGADRKPLERALSRFVEDPQTRFVLYLGDDGAATEVVHRWTRTLGMTGAQFVDRAFEVATVGDADDILNLLKEEAAAHRLDRIRCLPEPPGRAIEMLDRWILLAVHDKAILDKDDVANAHVILHGEADTQGFHRFGPRSFFTPGPLAGGRIGRLAVQPSGDLRVQTLDLNGRVDLDEVCDAGDAKLVVTG